MAQCHGAGQRQDGDPRDGRQQSGLCRAAGAHRPRGRFGQEETDGKDDQADQDVAGKIEKLSHQIRHRRKAKQIRCFCRREQHDRDQGERTHYGRRRFRIVSRRPVLRRPGADPEPRRKRVKPDAFQQVGHKARGHAPDHIRNHQHQSGREDRWHRFEDHVQHIAQRLRDGVELQCAERGNQNRNEDEYVSDQAEHGGKFLAAQHALETDTLAQRVGADRRQQAGDNPLNHARQEPADGERHRRGKEIGQEPGHFIDDLMNRDHHAFESQRIENARQEQQEHKPVDGVAHRLG